jgi:hypothetical protein
MKLPAMLVHVGTNDDAVYARQRGWIAIDADGTSLGFLPYGEDLKAHGFGDVPITKLIRITSTEYYGLITTPLLPTSI